MKNRDLFIQSTYKHLFCLRRDYCCYGRQSRIYIKKTVATAIIEAHTQLMKSIWKKKSLTKESCLKIICRQSFAKNGENRKEIFYNIVCCTKHYQLNRKCYTTRPISSQISILSLSVFMIYLLHNSAAILFISDKKIFHVDNLNVMMILKTAWNRIVLKIDTINLL